MSLDSLRLVLVTSMVVTFDWQPKDIFCENRQQQIGDPKIFKDLLRKSYFDFSQQKIICIFFVKINRRDWEFDIFRPLMNDVRITYQPNQAKVVGRCKDRNEIFLKSWCWPFFTFLTTGTIMAKLKTTTSGLIKQSLSLAVWSDEEIKSRANVFKGAKAVFISKLCFSK